MTPRLNRTFLLLLGVTLFACDTKIDEEVTIDPKSVNFNLSGYLEISDRSANGRIEDAADNSVTFIQVEKDNVDYADGVFFPDVTNAQLPLVGDGIYRLIVHTYKKGTGYGVYQSGNTVTSDRGTWTITNAFDPNDLQGFTTTDFDGMKFYTSEDSTSSELTEFPELDAYYINTTFDSDTVTDGQSIDLEVERRSAGLEIIANNFSEGEISIELDVYSSRQDGVYKLSYPSDSVYYLFAMLNLACCQTQNIDTKIYHEVDGTRALIYANSLLYTSNLIKRFEIDVAAANPSSGGISVTFSDEQIARGDTISIGGG